MIKNIDLACEIARRGAETVEQVQNNRMKLLYGILWHDKNMSRMSNHAWQLIKSFLTMQEKGEGITMAREILGKIRSVD